MNLDFDNWTDEEMAFLDYWQQFDTPWPGTESVEFKQWKEARDAEIPE